MIDPAQLERHRPRIWGLCYRMTGVAADADELVQETFVRALETPPIDLTRDVLPWLVRVATNASRDVLRRRKTQGYVGEWLPAPVEDDALGDEQLTPDARYGQAESVSLAFLVALEALSPTQRALVVLRDVLGYSVAEAAEVLSLSEANVKTTHHRARAALEGYEAERTRPRIPIEQARAAMMRFMVMVQSGEVERIASLLAEDVRAVNDGGGEFLAALNPIVSRQHVARFFLGTSKGAEIVDFQLKVYNGLPAVYLVLKPLRPRVAVHSVHLLDLDAAGELRAVYSVLATRKLAHLRQPL
jgi:RNA polymerase sigma factor (sigma-70 family)